MDSLELIRILILSNQIHAINKILSTLRNEGVDLNAQVASNSIELNKQIKFQNWDLILYCEESAVSIDVIKETLKTHGLDLPIIFLADKNSQLKTAEIFRIGVQDCLPFDDESKIIASIKREIGIQRLKLDYRLLKLEFRELENVSRLLWMLLPHLLPISKKECICIAMKVMRRYFPVPLAR